MLALTLLPFFLFAASFAAPSRRQITCIPSQALYLPSSQDELTRPDEMLEFVTLGIGYQNYTCSSQGTYTSAGAVVEVFDMSPTFPSPLFYNIQNVTLADWLNYDGTDDQVFFQQITDSYGIEDIGKQYYQNGANGLVQVWDFTQRDRPDAIATAVVVGSLASPYSGSVDWQHLNVTSGGLAQEILLLYTAGGEPHSQCTSGSGDISVKFTAQYWLFGGNVGSC